MKKTIYSLILMAGLLHAEQYICTNTWEGESKAYPLIIEVTKNKAIIKGSTLKSEYEIASNTDTELLIYKKFTKENSGSNYPVGFTVMALDKKTKAFVRSNTFATDSQNNHAHGSCSEYND